MALPWRRSSRLRITATFLRSRSCRTPSSLCFCCSAAPSARTTRSARSAVHAGEPGAPRLAECAGSAAAFGSVGVLVADRPARARRHHHAAGEPLRAGRDRALGRPPRACAARYRSLRTGAVAVGARRDDVRGSLRRSTSRRIDAHRRGARRRRLLLLPGARDGGRDRCSAASALAAAAPPRSALAVAASACSSRVTGWPPSTRPARCSRSPPRRSTRPTCSSPTALRDRVEPLALSTLVATGAALAFAAAAHACTAARRCTPPLAALAVVALALVPTAFAVSAFLSGLGASAPRVRASPRRSSRRSRSPAASRPRRAARARAVPGRRPRDRRRARDRAAQTAAPLARARPALPAPGRV